MSEWQIISDEHHNLTSRLEVPGGWLYRYGKELTFVPDPKSNQGEKFESICAPCYITQVAKEMQEGTKKKVCQICQD